MDEILPEVIKEDPEFIREGMRFYQRLRTKTDEVEESMKNLGERLKST